MSEEVGCMNCGEEFKGKLFTHPEYSGDNFCGDCLIGWWEEHIDESIAMLREAETETGITSMHYTVDDLGED